MQDNFKSGFVTLIGRPNVGKSTLMNRLIGQKIAITSNKPQTTRNRIQTVLTTEEGQIVFVDTPGIHKAKNKLGEYMVNIAERSLNSIAIPTWCTAGSAPTSLRCGSQAPRMKRWPRRAGALCRRSRPRVRRRKTNFLPRPPRACKPCWPRACAPSRSNPATAWRWRTNASNCAWRAAWARCLG